MGDTWTSICLSHCVHCISRYLTATSLASLLIWGVINFLVLRIFFSFLPLKINVEETCGWLCWHTFFPFLQSVSSSVSPSMFIERLPSVRCYTQGWRQNSEQNRCGSHSHGASHLVGRLTLKKYHKYTSNHTLWYVFELKVCWVLQGYSVCVCVLGGGVFI